MIKTKASAVSEPTPRCVLNRRASEHFSASCSMVCVSSLIRGLTVAYTLAKDIRGIPDPQLDVPLRHQPFKLSFMPSGFHPHAHFHSLGREIPVERLRFLAVLQSPLLQFSRIGIHKGNLLET